MRKSKGLQDFIYNFFNVICVLKAPGHNGGEISRHKVA